MDTYIKSANKRSGAKNLNLLPQFITYPGLFKATVQRIETDINRYTSFITESVDSAIADLNSYLIDKKYTLKSNIICVVLFALANETSCQIKVHYPDRDKIFDTHLLKPDSTSNGIIELSFINGHYDLVIKDMKQELITPTADSHRNLSNNFDVQNSSGNEKGNKKETECDSKVEFEPVKLTKKRVRSEVDSDIEERDFTTDESTRRSSGKLYVKDSNYDSITPIKVVEVPSSVNGNHCLRSSNVRIFKKLQRKQTLG